MQMVPPAWVEQATYALGKRRSIQLSYGGAQFANPDYTEARLSDNRDSTAL